MLIAGRIWKDGQWWLAESAIADVMTQGKTRTEAAAMLADAVESLVNRPGFKVMVRDAPSAGDGGVTLEASDPALLAALVLRRQREANGLSLSQAAEALGQTSKTAYARYEQGQTVPTIEKFEELLRAVSPEAAVIIGTRAPTKKAKDLPARARRRGRNDRRIA
jgi:hypothetical protein